MKRFFKLLGIAFVISLGTFSLQAQSINKLKSPAIQSSGKTDTLSSVTLQSFELSQTANTVRINWQTSREKNHNYFEIQRSMDGVNFEVIALMFAQEDAEKGAAYNYRDHILSSHSGSDIYYRLRMVDMDGKVLIISPKKVNFSEMAGRK